MLRDVCDGYVTAEAPHRDYGVAVTDRAEPHVVLDGRLMLNGESTT
jgi:hypothetical protein